MQFYWISAGRLTLGLVLNSAAYPFSRARRAWKPKRHEQVNVGSSQGGCWWWTLGSILLLAVVSSLLHYSPLYEHHFRRNLRGIILEYRETIQQLSSQVLVHLSLVCGCLVRSMYERATLGELDHQDSGKTFCPTTHLQ